MALSLTNCSERWKDRKIHQRYKWTNLLNQKQMNYAARDAQASYALYEVLNKLGAFDPSVVTHKVQEVARSRDSSQRLWMSKAVREFTLYNQTFLNAASDYSDWVYDEDVQFKDGPLQKTNIKSKFLQWRMLPESHVVQAQCVLQVPIQIGDRTIPITLAARKQARTLDAAVTDMQNSLTTKVSNLQPRISP